MQLKYVFLMTISCLGVTTLGRAADQFRADTDFVRKAEQSGNQEIADALVAIAMSKNAVLHKLAERIHEDGIAANRRLAELSTAKGWPTPALDPPDIVRHYSDHRYVLRQIQTEQDALAFYAEQAANGADTELQEFARRAVPILRQRLASLRVLQAS